MPKPNRVEKGRNRKVKLLLSSTRSSLTLTYRFIIQVIACAGIAYEKSILSAGKSAEIAVMKSA